MDKTKLLSMISEREREIVWHLAQGRTAKQIGYELNISPKTVITHRKNLKVKLKCKNCPQLIYKATRIGLVKNPYK